MKWKTVIISIQQLMLFYEVPVEAPEAAIGSAVVPSIQTPTQRLVVPDVEIIEVAILIGVDRSKRYVYRRATLVAVGLGQVVPWVIWWKSELRRSWHLASTHIKCGKWSTIWIRVSSICGTEKHREKKEFPIFSRPSTFCKEQREEPRYEKVGCHHYFQWCRTRSCNVNRH